MADRRLGDVPGIDDIIPIAQTLPYEDVSILEVNGVGEISAGEIGLGDLATPYYSDPFAVRLGSAEDDSPLAGPSGSPSPTGSPSPATSSTPVASTPTTTPSVPSAPTGPGEVFSGSVDGHDPYDLTEVDGETVDYLTAAALEAARKEFGGDFSIMQGSHNAGGVAASGGTHDGGGVVDLSVPNGDWAGAVAALRKIGFAAWVRNVPGYGQAGSGAHIHAVLIGNENLSSEAATQVQSYFNNDDGLAGSRADDGPREFVNNRFTWGDAQDMFDVHEPEAGDGDVAVGGSVATAAHTYLGVPFKWGGEAFDGVDAAGLVRKVYQAQGLEIPRDVQGFIAGAESIEVEKAKPGDLISWGDGYVGILGSDGYVIEANRPGTVVQLSTLDDLRDAFAIPYRTLAESMQTAPAHRPPSITPTPAQAAAPTYSPAPSAAAPSPGLSHGGDIAPKGGMSGGSPKPPKPTTTKQPLEGFI